MSEKARKTEQRKSVEQEVCRTCGVVIKPDTEHYPFCSTRCRGADLNSWFDGKYKISREIKDADLDTVD